MGRVAGGEGQGGGYSIDRGDNYYAAAAYCCLIQCVVKDRRRSLGFTGSPLVYVRGGVRGWWAGWGVGVGRKGAGVMNRGYENGASGGGGGRVRGVVASIVIR